MTPSTTRSGEREITLDIEGMSCASCVSKVEHALDSVPGVREARVNLATRAATVRTDDADPDALFAAVRSAGYDARPHEPRRDPHDEARAYRTRLVVAVACTLPILWLTFIAADHTWSQGLVWALTTPVVCFSGWPFFRSAVRAARHRTTTMDTLIAIGAGAAYAFSAVALLSGHPDLYFDTAAVIITLILVGKVLEARARATASDATRTLLERAPKEATILDGGREVRVPIEEVRPGDLAVVLPGEQVPADGVVKQGTSWVDLSMLTGESVPVDVAPGAEVVGASINGHGRLVVFITTVGADTALASIVRALERAQGSKAPIQRLADRISAVFVPVVLVLSALTFVGWWVVGNEGAGVALLNAITVLIIACPCALGLATPVAVMAGTGRAAELGVLFKGGSVFEAARRADLVLLDKTGTVTQGSMSLGEVVPVEPTTEARLLSLAAAAEAGSEHPIARAVVAGARRRRLDVPGASDHEVRPGAGAVAVVDGSSVRVGRPDGLPEALAASADRLAGAGQTPIGVWVDDVPIGLLTVVDQVRPDAASTVERLRRSGAGIAMITGDRLPVARVVADQVGIDDVVADVFPEGKLDEVQRLRARGHRVVFVGDGLNDAPALASADIGVAMGSGTDVALAAADINLLTGSLGGVADALALARATYRIVAQNLFWAFAYNVVMIPLAVAGLLNPMLAAAAMAASSVTVVLNALRLRRFGRVRRWN